MFKQSFLIKSLVTLALMLAVLLLLVISGGFVSAQDTSMETGEGPVQPTASVSTGSSTQPTDANAPIDQGNGEGWEASEVQVAPVTQATAASQIGLSHWAILGSHLQPRSSGTQFVYGGYGCMVVTNSGGDIRLQFPVILPDGSIVKSMEIFYIDTSTTANLTVWLTAYQPGVSSEDIVSVTSTGSTGAGSASSSEITHTIDNSANIYSLNYDWAGNTSSALQICGIRINYIDPFYSSFLPLVQ